jgi:hypothetical protein
MSWTKLLVYTERKKKKKYARTVNFNEFFLPFSSDYCNKITLKNSLRCSDVMQSIIHLHSFLRSNIWIIDNAYRNFILKKKLRKERTSLWINPTEKAFFFFCKFINTNFDMSVFVITKMYFVDQFESNMMHMYAQHLEVTERKKEVNNNQ